MIKETFAKGILLPTQNPESWFGAKYTMNIYRGCEHQCIYCDSRSTCYQIENFDDVEVKINVLDLLQKALKGKRSKAVVGTGSMSDPYTLCEQSYELTRKALRLISSYGFGIHINTKSDMILRDLDILNTFLNRVTVAFTLTTADDNLARFVEPYAPLPSQRLAAIKTLSDAGIPVGVLMMPVLPYIEDTPKGIGRLLEAIAAHGAVFCIWHAGMTCREGQREYYYRKLDEHFPGVKDRYIRQYGNQYACASPQKAALDEKIRAFCEQTGLITDFDTLLKRYPEHQPVQGTLFSE
jgi:DNA repair photolyase